MTKRESEFDWDAPNFNAYKFLCSLSDAGEAYNAFRSLHQYLEAKSGKTSEEIVEIIKHNIGYYTGYLGREKQLQVFELYDCYHPIFGREQPTPEEAFAKGQEMGKASKEGMQLEMLRQPKGFPRPANIGLSNWLE